MVTNVKCIDCDFQTVCVARNKLKPFFAEARTDLGVELDFVNCENFIIRGEDEASNELLDED